ncbi:MAG: bifunctional 4-hydroxy-2-oxoglutarate aldolase/2-dehydro-3-deoxy-phosphogluconate aldolase [Endomicrobium sp.]|nr:bifunctional 4-hydroxy-2-oxoglutarate aldolase/2-dehydro-3-deoxy-phosphogluconate aldolase [Endomicrobium sp.]
MGNDDLLTEISNVGIVPVVVLDNVDQALPLAKALYAGGIGCIEVTFRTAAAEEAIRILSEKIPEMLLGAGTVLTVEQANRAINAGARFIVSPGFNSKIVKYCIDNSTTIIPGCATPSDIESALELGIQVIKFFPAEAAGGLDMIRAMSAPYANVKFIPTGGINIKNLNTYLSFDRVIACGGSWIASKELVRNRDYEAIKKLAREAVFIMLGFEMQHIGINMSDETLANQISIVFETLFGFIKQERTGSFFAGSSIEIMKKQFLGKNGHIAISTNNVRRAIYYLEKIGVTFMKETALYDKIGNIRSIYLDKEIGNFAIHLLQKSN